MRQEAEKHAEEDRKKKGQVEIRNNAEQLLYATEKTIEELGDKIDEQKKEQVQQAMLELRQALETEETQTIEEKMETLSKVAQEIAVQAYQKAQQETQTTESGYEEGEEKKQNHDGESVDTDYEVT
jgi:molecular chaperone DnaK